MVPVVLCTKLTPQRPVFDDDNDIVDKAVRELSSLTIHYVDFISSRRCRRLEKRCRLIDISADWEASVGGSGGP